MLRRIIILFIITAISFSLFSFPSLAFSIDESKASVEAYYLFDIQNNVEMAQKNLDKIISPSSTTKIMTVCISLESAIDFNKEITVTNEMLKKVSGRNMELKAGDILTAEDLLHAVLFGGYNDAAIVLALCVSSSLDEFVRLMNEKAASLGMNQTSYIDVTGINSSAQTTVRDLAVLAKHMASNERFVKICSKPNYNFSENATCRYTSITNLSSLFSSYTGISNFNTGVGEDGHCVIAYYKTETSTLISIVMNALSTEEKDKENYAETYTKKLISHAINDYSFLTVKTTKEAIVPLPVKYSISNAPISFYLKEDVRVFLPENIDVNNDLVYSISIHGNELCAPLSVGDEIGTLTVSYNGIVLSKTPILSKVSIERNAFLYTMDRMKSFITSIWFVVILIAVSILILVLCTKKKRKFIKSKRKKKNKSKKLKK